MGGGDNRGEEMERAGKEEGRKWEGKKEEERERETDLIEKQRGALMAPSSLLLSP